jgi:hypothetical protein
MQTVKVLRSFNKTPQGDLADVGDTFEVEPTRAQELQRLGLAEIVGGTKAAPEPENKQAPAPENKAAPAPITAETAAPRRGRPAGSTRAGTAAKR